MDKRTLLQVNDLTVQLSGNTLLEGISFSLQEGERLAVIGASGSGKTTLINALYGRCFASGTIRFSGEEKPRIAVITQHHRFRNLSNMTSFYYQQRFNSSDSIDSVTVKEDLLAAGVDEIAVDEKLSLLGISHISDTRLIQLSNGEHKRFQLAKALLKNPEWLLLDSPYTGLDAHARVTLNNIIDTLAAGGMNILLVTSHADIPSCITHIASLQEGKIKSFLTKETFGHNHPDQQVNPSPHQLINLSTYQPLNLSTNPDFTTAMQNRC